MQDSYYTICAPVDIIYKERSSKFLTYAYPVESEEEVEAHLAILRKKYYDATHHCYAWRLGSQGQRSRANDDGEPSSTAGKPILGRMLSREVTNCLIVVVRYFGGTKLGVSGLIEAYGQSAEEVLQSAEVVERTVDIKIGLTFSYMAMNGVMKVVKEMQPKIHTQTFDNLCQIELSIRESHSEVLISKLKKVEGCTIEIL